MKFLAAEALEQGGLAGRPQLIELLAFVADMELRHFVRDHTLLPYRRCVASHKPELEHGDPSDLSMIRHSGTRVARPYAYFCTGCINDDLRAFGQSYWRRSHQIPGMYVCPTHGDVLQYSDDAHAFSALPSSYLVGSHVIVEKWAIENHANDYVHKFLSLSVIWSRAARPLNLRHVRPILLERARAEGLSIYPKQRDANLLSDRILSRFPNQWLETLFPGISGKQAGKNLNQLDGVLYCSTCTSSVSAYILAICVLFDSADEALAVLESAPLAIFQPALKSRSNRLNLDVQALKADYVSLKGCHSLIARNSNVSLSIVSARLLQLGLPNLTRRSRKGSLITAAINFYINELSLVESAEGGNVTVQELERLVRDAGVELVTALKEIEPTSAISRMAMALRRNQSLHLLGYAARPDGGLPETR